MCTFAIAGLQIKLDERDNLPLIVREIAATKRRYLRDNKLAFPPNQPGTRSAALDALGPIAMPKASTPQN